MTLRPALAVLAGVALLAPAAAQAMTLGEWLSHYEAVRKVPLAQAQQLPDFRTMVGALGEAAARYRQDIEDGKAGKRPLRACPPAEVSIAPDDLTASLERLPPEMRDRDLYDAVGAIMDARYPCPAPATT